MCCLSAWLVAIWPVIMLAAITFFATHCRQLVCQ
jgi:hypothetical protein